MKKILTFPLRLIQNILGQGLLLLSTIMVTIIGWSCSFFFKRDVIITIMYKFFNTTKEIMYKILGIQIEYRGVENIPLEEPIIFASKHQSSIETSFFFNRYRLRTVYAFKKELLVVPMWRRLSNAFGGIIIDRQKGKEMIEHFALQAKDYLDEGYCVAIFPEGTRVPIDKEIKFKTGIAKVYSKSNRRVVPVALNTGLILPKKSWFIKSGKIIIEFLPPIETGLSEDVFMERLQKVVNEKSNALVAEAKALMED